jgi:opacity protein-like surface antigen
VGGAALEFGVNDNFAVEARGLWVRKGAKLTAPGFDDAAFRISIDYLTVPVLFKLRGGGAIRPYVAVGPEVGFKLNAKTKLTLGDQEEEEDIDEDVKSTDFGVLGVAGLEFAAGRLGVFVEGGYSWGLTSIDENPLADAIDAKNGTILFVAGLRF